MKQGKLDIILALQLLEAEYDPTKDEKQHVKPSAEADLEAQLDATNPEGGEESKVQEPSQQVATNNIYKDLDESMSEDPKYQSTSWFSLKINEEDGTIKYGKYTQLLYLPPSLKPPFEEDQVTKTTVILDYIIEEFEYDAAYLAQFNKPKPKKKKVKKLDLSKKTISKDVAALIDERPFIVNTKK